MIGFGIVYTPECEVSMDELLMTRKVWLSWKFYIPSKELKFGMKSFEL
jgi:hypothetical protein